jgi:hypothetical protein
VRNMYNITNHSFRGTDGGCYIYGGPIHRQSGPLFRLQLESLMAAIVSSPLATGRYSYSIATHTLATEGLQPLSLIMNI